jgi:ABC-type transport system involved in cytochrome c biogenesis permease subunit
MISTTLFGITFILYVLALIVSGVSLVNDRKSIERASFWMFVLGFIAHTVALLVRWGEAGEVEVNAFQASEGRILQGMEWFAVWISHPPWSNMFESLVCFGWGMTAVSIYGIYKFQIRILSIFAITLSLVVMGAASLLVDQTITPLIPALQSKWIHLHVTMATISYPAFGLAAIVSLFYLMKVGVGNENFAVSIAAISAAIILMVGGGDLLTSGQFNMTLMGTHGGESYQLSYGATDAAGNSIVQNEAMRMAIPGAGLMMGVSAIMFLSAFVFYSVSRRMPLGKREKLLNLLLGGGFLFLCLLLVDILFHALSGAPIQMTQADALSLIAPKYLGADGNTLVESIALHGSGPYQLSLGGNPFEFMLLVTVWLAVVFYFALVYKRDWLTAQLPSADRLDDLAYKTILFAFPFLTLLIITGAVWAYYAWGRYWGWDPKETWSLVTWIVYSIYLHVRITHGWEGKIPAVLSVVGFAVVIFTYLGVNILLSGLHSYGGG